MLTPVFEVSQSEALLTIIIHAKFAKIAETEVYFHENDFKFYSRPYYLRLTLPGEVLSVDECDYSEIAKYDVDSGIFTIKIRKKNQGEHFENLDLLTKLLAKPPKNKLGPTIEVISEVDETNLDEDFDWHIEQNVYNEEASLIGNEFYYGFGNKKCGVLSRLQEELSGIIDIKNPNLKSPEERRKERINQESKDFSDDHYLADLYESESEIEEFVSFEPRWDRLEKNSELEITFTEDEKFILKELPRKEYLLTSAEIQSVALGLVDIIFSYAYQHRTTLGENNVESGWTISKLSPTLSWFETHATLKSTLISVIRRNLTYPLYRNWKLSQRVLKDTLTIFKQGQKQVLKCLLEVRRIFLDCDNRFIFNDLYITDYCVWTQLTKEKVFKSLTKSLREVKITKNDVDLDLVELELAAEEVKSELTEMNSTNPNTEINQICENLEGIDLNDKEKEKSENKTQKNEDSETGENVSGNLSLKYVVGDEESDECSSDSDSSGHYYLDSDDEEEEKENSEKEM